MVQRWALLLAFVRAVGASTVLADEPDDARYPTGFARRPLVLDQGMLRVDGRFTVGGTDRPGTISALDLGVALSPIDSLELGRRRQHRRAAGANNVVELPLFLTSPSAPRCSPDRFGESDLEHGIIRPRFEDPRIHVALNCGAQSCPPLHPKAFVSRTLDATLDELSRAVVGDPSLVRVEEDSLSVSKIFHWYSEDFEKEAGSVLDWLKRYDAAGRLDRFTSATRLRRLPYDWKLNMLPAR